MGKTVFIYATLFSSGLKPFGSRPEMKKSQDTEFFAFKKG